MSEIVGVAPPIVLVPTAGVPLPLVLHIVSVRATGMRRTRQPVAAEEAVPAG